MIWGRVGIPYWRIGKLALLSSPGIAIIIITIWILKFIWRITSGYKVKLYIIVVGGITLLYWGAGRFISLFVLLEFSIAPIIGLILTFGYQPERARACLYIFMYTLVTSFPIILMIIWGKRAGNGHSIKGTGDTDVDSPYPITISNLIGCLFIICFLAKIPIFFLHFWLPKAHLQAPFFGSILLARIYLKIGIFGLMRTLQVTFGIGWITERGRRLAIIGSLIIALRIIFQVDSKRIIALASIVHIALSASSMIGGRQGRDFSGIIISIGHGIRSSLLFYINYLIYTRYKTRSLILSSGLETRTPLPFFFYFLGIILNFSFPLTLNLVSEIYLLLQIRGTSLLLRLSGLALVFLNLLLSLYIYWGFKRKRTQTFPPLAFTKNVPACCLILFNPARLIIWGLYTIY